MIPRVIHYCWFGGAPLPREVWKNIAGWKRACPGWEIRRWDEGSFDLDCHPFVRAAYADKAWAFVSDYARLKIIHEQGGVYLDTDVELLKSPDALLDESLFVGVSQQGLINTGLGFGACEHHPLVYRMLEMYDGVHYKRDERRDFACPHLNHAVFAEIGYAYSEDIVHIGDAAIYPCRYFDPVAPGDQAKNLLCSDSVSIHHYANSWGTSRERVRRRLINLVGVERIARLKNVLYGKREGR